MTDGRRIGRSLRWGAVPLALAVWLAAGAAGAELLRCMGPDGKMIYTDNKALCPGAKPFEPKGEVQVAPETPGRDGAASRDPGAALAERLRRAKQRQAAFEAEEAEAERWRRKKSTLQANLGKIQERREYLEKFITNCNRGGLVFARDDAGIKRTIKCQDIKAQYARLGDEEQEAQAALTSLPEECRKAGCLPGWLR